jgi:hypothetical protein
VILILIYFSSHYPKIPRQHSRRSSQDYNILTVVEVCGADFEAVVVEIKQKFADCVYF